MAANFSNCLRAEWLPDDGDGKSTLAQRHHHVEVPPPTLLVTLCDWELNHNSIKCLYMRSVQCTYVRPADRHALRDLSYAPFLCR